MNRKDRKARWWMPLIAFVLASAMLMEMTPGGWKLAEHVGREKLHAHNEKYLDQSTEEAFATFLLLSGMKTGLAVMNSSSAGVSFIVEMDVQVGEMMTSAKEVVDYGWRASIFGLSTLGALRIVLETLYVHSSFLVLTSLAVLLALSLVHNIWRAPPGWLTGTLRILLIVSLLGGFGIPLAVGAASMASEAITAPHAADMRDQLHSNHKTLIMQHDGDVKAQAKAGIKSYTENAQAVTEKHRHLTEQIIRHLVLVMFDAIVFPLGFLLVAIILLRGLTRGQIV